MYESTRQYFHIDESNPHVNWKAFVHDGYALLLHIPTSHIVEIPPEFGELLCQGTNTPETIKNLEEIGSQLPEAQKREAAKVDITAIAINVSQSCNFRCVYCYADKGDYGHPSMMDFDMAKKTIDFFVRDTEKLLISFFGGEPLMNLELIKEVVTYCKSIPNKEITYQITSNGSLLNDETILFFKDNKFKVQISFDCLELQGKQRFFADGSETETMVLSKLDALKKEFPEPKQIVLRSTVTKDNISLLEKAALSTLRRFNTYLALIPETSCKKERNFNREDILRIGNILEKIVDTLLKEEDFEALINITNIGGRIAFFHNGKCLQPYCGAGISYLSVSCSGNFYLCHRYTENKNAFIGDLESGIDHEKLQTITRSRLIDFYPCNTCWMRELCGGGCFHQNEAATGDYAVPDPLGCLMQNIEYEQAMRVYMTLLTKKPELLERLEIKETV